MSLITQIEPAAPVTNISRCSIHDGPGVRTVVYLKGCAMRCGWCHNPETLRMHPEILCLDSKCIGCGRCAEICPECHTMLDGMHIFRRENCTACGKCADTCPKLALTLCGRKMTVSEVMKEIRKDAHFFKRTGGGVTLSGGECLLHPEFASVLLEACHREGIHTAIESAFFAERSALERVMQHTDLFFADCKLPTAEKHLQYTGREQAKILDNIRYLASSGANIILRIPVIPGVNDSAEDMRGFAKVIASLGEGIREIELLRYNNLGASKYEIAGMEFTPFADQPQSKEEMTAIQQTLSGYLPGYHIYFVM